MAESDLIRGNVDTIILKVLYDGDRYGYDLIKQINAKSDGQWEIKQPTVYACLKRLEKQGFVSSYWDSSESDGGRRKYYSLTESGREVFLQYKNEFERANALFGGIIMGSEPVYLQDDYSDVEDEGYDVPKRRPAKRARKAKHSEQPVTEPQPVSTDYTQESSSSEQTELSAQEEPTLQTVQVEQPPVQPVQIVYVQQDLFGYENQPQDRAQEQPHDEPQEQPSARAAVDPRSIIDKYFAQEHGESYSDVHGKTVYEDNTPPAPPARQTNVPVAVKETATSPAPVTEVIAPAPVGEKQATAAPPVNNDIPMPLYDEESPARREYKTVLSDLVERFEIAQPDIRNGSERGATEQAAAVEAERDDGRFYKVRQAASECGNEITIRDHNDSAKEYTHKYYYYGNRLMMTHYTIMCSLMFVLGLIMFLTFYSGLHMRMKYDYLLYIGAGLLPIFMFIVAVIKFASDPDKIKRVNVNFRLSVIIRCVIMLQVAVVIYCVNLIWGMPVSFSANYIPSLIIPIVYALFIPVSEVIFMTLLKSEHYAAE